MLFTHTLSLSLSSGVVKLSDVKTKFSSLDFAQKGERRHEFKQGEGTEMREVQTVQRPAGSKNHFPLQKGTHTHHF